MGCNTQLDEESCLLEKGTVSDSAFGTAYREADELKYHDEKNKIAAAKFLNLCRCDGLKVPGKFRNIVPATTGVI